MLFVRTKIICTIGPSVASYEKIVGLMQAGMSVARLNFAHGTLEEHKQIVDNLKKARSELKLPMAIMIDIKGPEIRVGKLPNDVLQLDLKQRLKLVALDAPILPGQIPMRPIEALESVEVGMKILFDDGNLISHVIEIGPGWAVIEMENGGLLKSGKGINIPAAHLALPAVTPKDIVDLKFGCENDIDLVAASFIRSAHNILSIKEILAKEGKSNILVIAKIENNHGIENFDSIVQASDGIMVARGDLGVELELARVPKLQKMMIRKCFQACKPSITATQMLESMITNIRPTRAEVSDVANAIYDGTSSIMLSGETAVGKYPIEAVLCMSRIAKETEADFNYRLFFERHSERDYHDLASAVALAAVKTAYSANAKAIFAFTHTGRTARFVSRLRPEIPIVAVTSSEKVYHQLASNWGVVPVLCHGCSNAKQAFAAASSYALSHGIISFGDVVVVMAGTPFGKKGSTNMMVVENIGDVLVRGHKGFGSKVKGKVSFLFAPEDCDAALLEGRIAVIPHCDNSFLAPLKRAAGVILQNYIGDTESEKYAVLIAKTFEIPVMYRADGAMTILQEDEEVTLDPQKGLVYRGAEEASDASISSFDG